ncbi:hypothetical protein HWV62_35843 [Athelia sp. TMB]|nr:hypothetical protein HWV62_35843 [Athelia sp. TMB]
MNIDINELHRINIPPETVVNFVAHIPPGSLTANLSSISRAFACAVRAKTIGHRPLQINHPSTAARFFSQILALTPKPPVGTAILIPALPCHITNVAFNFALRGPRSPYYDSDWSTFWSLLQLALPQLIKLKTFTFRFCHRENQEALEVLSAHAMHFPPSLKSLRMLSVREEQYDQEQPDWPIHLASLNTISTFYLATHVCTVFPPIHSEEIATMHLWTSQLDRYHSVLTSVTVDFISREDNIKPMELCLTDRYFNAGWCPDNDEDEEEMIDEQTLEWVKGLKGWTTTHSSQVRPLDS